MNTQSNIASSATNFSIPQYAQGTFPIKLSFNFTNEQGYFMGKGYEDLCIGNEETLIMCTVFVEQMKQNYFIYNLSGRTLANVTNDTLRSVIGNTSQLNIGDDKNINDIMSRIVTLCRNINHRMTLAELLLGLQVIR